MSDELNFKNELKVAIEAAYAAGKNALEKRPTTIEEKSDRSRVTDVDKENEELILTILREKFPDYKHFAEEGGKSSNFNDELNSSDFCWFIDPIDGTDNYLLGQPFAIEICLVYGKEPVVGVLYLPASNQLFSAVKGQGAHCNGEKISVSNRPLSASTFDFGKDFPIKQISLFSELFDESQGYRALGSGGVIESYIASGRLDAYIHEKYRAWDIAAGTIIIKEAGGQVTDFSGNDLEFDGRTFYQVAISNGVFHDQLLEKITKYISVKDYKE